MFKHFFKRKSNRPFDEQSVLEETVDRVLEQSEQEEAAKAAEDAMSAVEVAEAVEEQTREAEPTVETETEAESTVETMDVQTTETEAESTAADETVMVDETGSDADNAMSETDAEMTEEAETAQETEKPVEKKGFFGRLKESLGKTRAAISDKVDAVLLSLGKIDEELYEELEEALIMSDIGTETSAYMIERLKTLARERGVNESFALKGLLREIVADILEQQDAELHLETAPAVIMVIGVNGVGKTTSIGKLAHYYRSQGKKVILAAADTFRAAAIDQLEIWAERAGVELVKHQEGADPSAVVFDSIKAAKARGADLVICDTAGRLHNKKNLMEELKKTAHVVERETGGAAAETLLVLDASTGQNALNQARDFAQAAGITGVILTKLDGTAKGGVILALSREQGLGVKFIGVGEQIDDLRPFDPTAFAEALFPQED